MNIHRSRRSMSIRSYFNCINEYDEVRNNELLRAECFAEGRKEGEAKGRAEGKAEGRAEGTIRTIIDFLKDGLISEDIAAKKANMSVTEFRKLLAQLA